MLRMKRLSLDMPEKEFKELDECFNHGEKNRCINHFLYWLTGLLKRSSGGVFLVMRRPFNSTAFLRTIPLEIAQLLDEAAKEESTARDDHYHYHLVQAAQYFRSKANGNLD